MWHNIILLKLTPKQKKKKKSISDTNQFNTYTPNPFE